LFLERAGRIFNPMPSILVADDNEAVRTSVRTTIEKETDLQVCGEAMDGLDAVEKTRELHPDLVVLDVVMPKLNGVAAAAVIRKQSPDVRIVLFTIFPDLLKALGPAVGIDLVVLKQDGVRNLIKQVRALLTP
jgi:DNA-binding NarL/FixJ family response regulator